MVITLRHQEPDDAGQLWLQLIFRRHINHVAQFLTDWRKHHRANYVISIFSLKSRDCVKWKEKNTLVTQSSPRMTLGKKSRLSDACTSREIARGLYSEPFRYWRQKTRKRLVSTISTLGYKQSGVGEKKSWMDGGKRGREEEGREEGGWDSALVLGWWK